VASLVFVLGIAAAQNRTAETRVGIADTSCLEVSRFDIAAGGRSFAYAGRCAVGKDTSYAVWRDGQVGASSHLAARYDSVIDLQLTPTGKLWFGARESSHVFISYEGQKGRAYDRIDWRSVSISSDGSKIAYVAAQKGRLRVAVNSTEGKAYDGIGLPFFGSDGRTIIYPAFEGERFGPAKWFVVTGTQEGRKYDCDYLGWVKQSANGAKLAYAVYDDGKAFVVENERAGTKYDDVGWLEFIPNSARLVHTAKAHGRYFVVRDGYPLRDRYDEISFPTFSADGGKFAFVASEGNQEFAVNGSHRGRRFDQVLLPQFSPDGKQLAYIARQGGKWLAVAGDKPGKGYDEVSWFVWSSDGTSFAYRAKIGSRCCLVIAGSEGKLDDDICRLQFGPDGKHLSYAARRGREFYWNTVELR
jgi:hypothetical protein